jgi:hypothetical protein
VASFEITPEPGEAERKAILAALGAENAERQTGSDWADAQLPERPGEEDEP